jgi:DNA uptake protein ComE-like DNA-binding protein
MGKVSGKRLLWAAAIISIAAALVILVHTRPDINKADEGRLYAALVAVDGIGEYLAGEIISQRPYLSWDDLKNKVDGVGDKRLGSLKFKFNLRE